MKPFLGMVVKMVDSILTIKLEKGLTIEHPQVHGLKTGDKVLALYDYTKGKVREILPDVESAREREIDIPEPHKADTPDEDDDADVLVLDSGALLTAGDEGLWEFWDSDSGILGLSGL